MSFLAVDVHQKIYENGCLAIENLKFSCGKGEFIAIVGPSGAGKSTLLNMVSGLDKDYSGSVAFAGQAFNPSAVRLGFLFQECRLLPWLTVYQNLQLVIKNAVAAVQAKPLDDWLQCVGLQGCGDLFPGQLSGGMQRRVALLRAFIVAPDVLLMDEPFQSLDAPTAAQLRRLLHELWQQSAPTVLFVTHNLREAISVANRIVFLSARPSRVILDYPLTRSAACAAAIDMESDWVTQTHQQILDRYPNLLSGLHLD
ncbi:MAG: ATP-binding cassette domain-containing protein [Rhodoferax sp.]|uniref:ABC transporter ATP-binding protein n=1 Tax=Rhodoferax sp. TaxID=50421 RepID=UPI00260F52FD|nr:ATP-binding cassette domain-containing protein [Rhodoferax sp.]MDD2879901.1 ATP-binding cassette domain-containing protein [Rhodoferax sp.]